MRLFSALDLPAEVVGNLERLLDRLRGTARLKWSPPENMHITTKFIGEWPDERLAEIEAALRALRPYAPIPVTVHNLGFFPNPRSPRVFWAGVDASPDLKALAEETDRALAALGIASEQRSFSPHLTLARIREPVPLEGLRQAIARLDSCEFGAFVADQFYLYQSRLSPHGSTYTRMAEFRLEK